MCQLPPNLDIPSEEEKISQYWDEIDAFKTSQKLSVNKPRYTFYDGPPFATGLPHYGHLLAGTIKDIVTRHAHQAGYHVERRFGWDCHGLPVEYEVDKELGISGPQDVFKMGVAAYNEKCRSIVMRYSSQWEKVTKRLGRWIDFENDYRTMYPWFMESVWWVFKQLFDKGLVYRGMKVMPFSTACATPLSNFEAGQNYRDVQDPAVIVSFPVDKLEGVELVAWTTTPWTLVSNLSLCVNPDKDYVKIKDINRKRVFILMKARLPILYKHDTDYEVIQTLKGKELEGLTYKPLFAYFGHLKEERQAFRVLCDSYVTEDVGTGIVHQAPYFGEDDFRVCLSQGIIGKDTAPVCPVDASGRFTAEIADFQGLHVKDADKGICQQLKLANRLVHQSTLNHSYPFCWRSDTPLIYKALPTWFIRVENLIERLLVNNSKSFWVPEFVREGRFANWIRDARDWAVSRNRFWGTPLPLWASEDWEEIVCVGSIDELARLSGVRVTDLHKHIVDDITIPSSTGRGVLRRVPEVFDCWFESGSMPYAQLHYPFENTKVFEEGFPADFIAEGIDQTRGWFYTLLVISTALFDRPPFKNLIVNGIVLAADGQKMSKRAKNYPDPLEVISRHGADALRLYLINSPVVRAQNLRFFESGVHDVVKDVFLPWYNALRFLLESSVLPYERSTGRSFSVSSESSPETDNFMDLWILSFTQSLILYVQKELKEYRLYTVVPRLVKFIDHLVNWYVRMNRRRLKGDSVSGDADWRAALHTLTKVLHQMVCMMTPFTPFFSEFLFQRLRTKLDFSDHLRAGGSLIGHCPRTGCPQSVHYLACPRADLQLISTEIETTVSWMQAAVELGRIIRTRVNLPLKAPLLEAIVVHSDSAVLASVKAAEAYIVEELNVRRLTLTSDKQRYGVHLRGQLNHRTVGARMKQSYQAVVAAVKAMSTEELEKFVATGSITVCGHELTGDDLSVSYTVGEDKTSGEPADPPSTKDPVDESMTKKKKKQQQQKEKEKEKTTQKPGVVEQTTGPSVPVSEMQRYQTASDARGLLVILDTSPDPGLDDERIARELVNRIQRTRKKAQLVPEDPIVVVVSTASENLRRVTSSKSVDGSGSSLADLIQATVKQPLSVTQQRVTVASDGDVEVDRVEDAEELLRTSGRCGLPSGWCLGDEIIRDTVSIPPDEFELVFFSRHPENECPTPTSNRHRGPDVEAGAWSLVLADVLHEGETVKVVHTGSGVEFTVGLTDGREETLVADTDDLLRKVRCVLGWSKSANTFLYRRRPTGSAHSAENNVGYDQLELLPHYNLTREPGLLAGQTLYAVEKRSGQV